MLDDSWQHDTNRRLQMGATAGESAARHFVAIKDRLKAFSNGVVVKGSCDASAFGMDSVDRITDYTKVVSSSSGNRSWIVLEWKQGMQVCFSFNTSNNYTMSAHMSVAAGFTGGALNARPTATDEVTVLSSTHWTFGNVVGGMVLHILHSEDGKRTRVFGMRSGALVLSWVFGNAANPCAGWASPWTAYMDGSGSATLSQARLFANVSLVAARGPSGSMPLHVSQEGCNVAAGVVYGSFTGHANLHAPQPHSENQRWPISQLGLWSLTVGMKAKAGRMADLWYSSGALPSGHVIERDGLRLAKLGDFLVPWQTGVRVLTG